MAIALVTITGAVLTPDGDPVSSGTIEVTLSQAGSVLDGAVSQRVAGGGPGSGPTVVVTLGASGVLPAAAKLAPNDAIVPSGTYYAVKYNCVTPDGTKARWTEKWQLASAPSSIAIGAVPRLGVIPGLSVSGAAAQSEANAAASATAAAASAASAATAKTAAETARDQALATGRVYPDTTAGLTASAEGEYFLVPSAVATELFILYREVGGAASEIKRYSMPPQDWYVDSVGGLDANNGKTPTTPLQTIAALLAKPIATRDTVHLARGSKWREILGGLPAKVDVLAYGSGPRPLFDCSDVAANGTFTKTAGRTNVYQIAWSVAWAGPYSGGDRHGVWENGVRLASVADVATCDSTPGSFYAPQPISATDTIYVHAVNSSDVTVNGRTYELCKRSAGVVSAVGGALVGLHARRNAGNNGSILSYYYASDCLAEEGSNHNMWVEGVAEDCVAWKIYPSKQYGDRTMFVTFLSAYGLGSLRGPVYRRCRAVAGDGEAPIGYYIHTGGGPNFQRATYEDCWAVNCSTAAFGGTQVDVVLYKNPRISGSAIAMNPTTAACYILGGLIDGRRGTKMQNAVGSGTNVIMRGVRVIVSGNTNQSLISSTALDIRRCTFVVVDPGAAYYWKVAGAGTSLVFRENIVSGFNHLLETGAGAALDSDQNVVFGAVDVKIGATTHATFAAYQAATGQDAGSSTSDPLFLGQPRNGDMRVGDTSPAWARLAGAEHDGEDLDVTLLGQGYAAAATP